MSDWESGAKMTREGKDSLFCDLFSQKDYLYRLYRALHPEDEEAGLEDLEVVSIERIVTDGGYNDLGFTVGDRLVVLVEAQSTWSANIVTRMLFYLAETYRRRLEGRGEILHAPHRVPLPTPELYVIYSGDADVPDTVDLKRDILHDMAGDVDVRVHVLRGDTADVIGQYVGYCAIFDDVRTDDSIPLHRKAAEVVRRCLDRGILEQYMQRRRQEVENMMHLLFDQERETRLYHEYLKREAEAQGRQEGFDRGIEEGREIGRELGLQEGRQEGRQEGLQEGMARSVAQLMRSQSLTVDQAMDILAISEGDREKIAALAAK